MISRCAACGTLRGEAGVPHPLVIFGLASLVTGLAVAFLATLSPWWWLSALPVWLGLVYILYEGPRRLEMLRNRYRTCATCGRSVWSRPHYGGFV